MKGQTCGARGEVGCDLERRSDHGASPALVERAGLFRARWWRGLALSVAVVLAVGSLMSGRAVADPYPPTCDYLSDPACPVGPGNPDVHYPPIEWPVDASFFAYTQFGNPILDPRTQDGSNGGATPQNYVNVSSECPDRSQPSVKLALDPVNDVVVFRWRTEQIANTYATGPSAGAYSSSDPWNSAQWTVLIDTDGDGFRNFALHLDGSSGEPAEPIDRVAAIWGDTSGTQSLDYPNDPNIYYLAHNPAAFIDAATQKILNFQNTLTATPTWPNGSAETVWDYGTTRSTNMSTPGCNEYQLDYQIPISMLNASVCCQSAPGNICESPSVACTADAQCTNPAFPRCLKGETIDADTPFSLLFVTANSLTDPLQKDIVMNGDFVGGTNNPLPFGDPTTLTGGTIVQPVVKSVQAQGCGSTRLTTQVMEAPLCETINGPCTTSIDEVEFYYYYDRDGDGVANDGQSWTLIGAGTTNDTPLGRFTASWDSTSLYKGQYLVGVQAMDRADLNASGKGNRTFSYLGIGDIPGLCGGTPPHDPELTAPPEPNCPPLTEDWFGNLTPRPGKVVATFQNTCGMDPPGITKQVLTAQPVPAGSPTQFRITVNNPNADNAQTIVLSSIDDVLPQDPALSGFTFVATNSDTCGATASPNPGDTTLAWTFAPSLSLPGGTSCSITFTATAPTTVSTYANTATAITDFGQIESPPVDIGIGPAYLTIAKSANVNSAAPGSTITYTLTYSNDSAISATGVVITDVLPTGLTFVSATGGGTYDGGTRTITWNIGSLASGEGPFTVSFNATVDNPYPAAAAIPLVNTATIDSVQTAPASSSSSTFITAPRPNLVLQKTPNKVVVDPNGVAPANQVIYTVSYANNGNATASGVVITDAVPAGFTFVSAAGCTHSVGVLTCNIGSLASGASGSVTYTLQASLPFTGIDPTINTATIDSNETSPVSASANVGIRAAGDASCPPGSDSNIFYFHDEEVAIPGQGNQDLANLISPVPADVGATSLVTAPGGGAFVPALTFYQQPAATRTISIAGNLTTTLFINRSPGPGITIRGTVQTWRDGVGVIATLGTGTQSYGGNQTGSFVFTIAAAAGTLQSGDRLRWFFEVASNTGSDATLLFQWDGTACNSQTDPPCVTTTFANSRSIVCFTEPATLVANKRVDKLSAQAGDSLAYTFDFGNNGGTTVTGASISDTFPAGVNVSGCTYSLNGAAAAACSCLGQTCTFAVNSVGQPSGQIPSAATGTLVVNVAVASPLAGGIFSIINSAVINSNETTPPGAATNSVTTSILRPNVTIAKSASDTLLIPGNTVTYTLTVQNSGTASAAGVQVIDVLPVTGYFTYVAGSVSPGGPTCSQALGTITCNLGALAVGATTTVTFQMQVAAVGVPDGSTVLGNTATVSDSATTGTRTSNNVDVSISTNPNLHLNKAVVDLNGGAAEAGDTLRYTLIVNNDGSGTATDVLIADPIPAYTSFASVSCSSGTGSYDTGANQAVCSLASLAGPAGVVTMTVDVVINTPLPSGTTAINNTATVSASNAASKTDSASINASAAPLLSVTKFAPAAVAYPLTTLSAAAAASTTISVASASYISVTDFIVVGGTVSEVTGVSGNTITLATPVTAGLGANVLPTWLYVLVYENEGDATATNVVVSDTLPAGLACVSTSPAADAPGCAATVNWTVGTLAPGDAATLRMRVRPTVAGTFVNTATIDSTETAPVPSNPVTTAAGGILLTKSTSTPLVQNDSSGTQAVYTITLANQTAGASAGVTVTDTLPPGFTFVGGSSSFGGGTCTGLPTGGTAQPTWTGCSVPASGSLTITFTVNVAATVGAGTYQNPVRAAGGSVAVIGFEELDTTAEDVTVYFNTLSGTVFTDINGNGIQDAAETGIAGVTVTVTGPSCPAGCTLVTDGSGNYSIGDLAPGTYYVVETDPAGYTSTTPNLVPIAIVAGDSVVNFGDLPQYTISGVAFEDSNANGVQDPGEPGLVGVTIELFSPGVDGLLGTGDDVLVATKLTDANGQYVFSAADGVVAGNYLVQETDPAGYASTTANVVPVSVATGGAATANFGDLQVNTIAGTVFNDLNGNGIQDPDEPGISGVTVTLEGTTAGSSCNPVACTAVTDADGNYQFTALSPGAYSVTETDLPGFTSTTSNEVLVNLAAGEVGHADFGDQLDGRISGVVYSDVNADGTRDGSEPALVGVTVELYSAGPDGRLGTPDDVLVATTVTGPYGYEFTNVAPGTYLVVETDPSGWASTTPNAVPVSVGAGGSASADFGDIVEGALAGVVFNDLNGNGVQDPGEPGIGGVTVTVTGTSAGADCLAGCTAVTAGDGSYIFIDLAPGSYDVVETDPTGFTSTTSNTLSVEIVPGSSASANFGDQLIGSVSGTVFFDVNGNGVQDPGEGGIGGVVVQLIDPATGAVVAATVTAGDGSYLFTGVAVGDYVVRETDPAGFASTTANEVPVSVGTGGAATANFGDTFPNSISGTVFEDVNGNGVQDPGEPGLAGVTVTLTGSSGGASCLGGCTATTAGDGTYLFTGLLPGSYIVEETDPAGFTSTTSNTVPVTLASGETATADFGDQLIGTISGVVFNDLNGNGVQDPGEPGLGGVTVELLNPLTGAVIDTTTTAVDGSYQFTGVAAGAYVVRESDPTGFASTTPNEVPVTVSGSGAATANFGDIAVNSIAGTVFNDLNGNGVQDPGEAGIGGVTVSLYSLTTGVLVGTTTTSGDGTYVFNDLAAGTYRVEETDPAGFTSTTANSVTVNLVDGGTGTADFGDRMVGSVSGTVYLDRNGNGVQDPGEVGLAGVDVTLVGPSCPAGCTVATDADGNYLFIGLTPGNYSVTETDPTGFTSSTPNTVNLGLAAGESGSANFGDLPIGSISGVVFNDLNGNGQQDPGESGLGGVSVRVVGPSCPLPGGCVLTTAGDGSYYIDGMSAGDYTVTETNPAGFGSTTPDTVAVTLPLGGAATANFGDRASGTLSGVVFLDLDGDGVQDADEPGLAGVTVTVTGSGGASCLAGCTAVTTADGHYLFLGLSAGNYTVVETNPSGFTSTTPDSVPVVLPFAGSASVNFGDQAPVNPDVSIAKTDAGIPRAPGDQVVYTITVSNAGPTAASNVVVTDTLDADTTYVSNTGGCVQAPIGTLTCTVGNLSAGSSSVFTVTAQIDAGAPVVGTREAGPCNGTEDICNQASVTLAETDTDPSNNTDSEPTNVVVSTQPVLQLVKNDSPDTVVPGGTLTYTLTYSNVGSVAIDNVVLTEDYDPRTTFVSANPPPDLGNDVWVIGTLQSGESASITITMAVSGATGDGDVLVNDAVLTGDGVIDADVSEQTLVAENPGGTARLALSKSGSPNPIPAGGLISYTLVVSNAGPAVSYDTIVSDSLPSELVYMNAVPAPTMVAGNYLEWDVGDLPAGASTTIAIYAQVSGAVVNGQLIDNCADADGSDGPGTSATSGLHAEGCDTVAAANGGTDCNLVMRKRSIGTPTPDGEIVYRCLWCDPCVDAPEVVIIDDLPAELEFVSLSSLDIRGYQVTDIGGRQRVTLDVGKLPAGRAGMAYMRVRVKPEVAPGTVITNNIALEDAATRTANDDDVMVVAASGTADRSTQSPSVKVDGPKRVRSGGSVKYLARYRNLAPGATAIMEISEGVDLTTIIPAPSARSSHTLLWADLSGSGTIQVRGKVDMPTVGAVTGGILSAEVMVTDGIGTAIAKGGIDTAVMPSLAPGSSESDSGSRARVALSGSSYIRSGMTAALTIRYSKLAGIGRAALSLPDGMTLSEATPRPTRASGGQLEWDALPSTGQIRVIALVQSGLATGSTLIVNGSVGDDAGVVGLEKQMSVR